MVQTQNRRAPKGGWEVTQASEWRAKKFRLGAVGFCLGLAALSKFIVVVISVVLGEGSITFLTFPLVFVAFFMDLAEYDRLAVQIARSDARMLGNESPRKTRRWATIFGWIWGLLLGLTLVAFVFAAATREPTASSTTPVSTSRSDDATVVAASPTTTIVRSQPILSCDAVISSPPEDDGATTCVYAASPDRRQSIARWDCRESSDVYFSVPTADDSSMVWYAASYDTAWTLLAEDEREVASERCRPDN